MTRDRRIEDQWDAEYARGRYTGEGPVSFIADICRAVAKARLSKGIGLYIGCGNGRNFVPLVQHGLRLDCVDISGQAIQQLRARLPGYDGRLVHGAIDRLPADLRYDFILGIQVFQHGDGHEVADLIKAAQERLRSRGVFCLRVNAVGTDIVLAHEVLSERASAGKTIRYLAGPKEGQLIHFFDETELHHLFPPSGWSALLKPRLVSEAREASQGGGSWSQFEAIWRRGP